MLIQISTEQDILNFMTDTQTNENFAMRFTNGAVKQGVKYAKKALQKDGHRSNIVNESVTLAELLSPFAALNDDRCIEALPRTELVDLLSNVLSAPDANGPTLPANKCSLYEKSLAARCCARLTGIQAGRALIDGNERIANGSHVYLVFGFLGKKNFSNFELNNE